MNAFYASENSDAFIVFRFFPSYENAPKNSSQNWSSLKGSDQRRSKSRRNSTPESLSRPTMNGSPLTAGRSTWRKLSDDFAGWLDKALLHVNLH
ncbi:hypothetical protein EFD55_32730 [Rhizobium pisi]|uniref:Uncharacterized protein n=1 Tax=Rhizobium pisi TaxID=574561 RepID=A0A3R9AYT9_9HYPH|nr:hypothetical protein EFD55_32730 [Rhizobium pisi]